MYRAIARNKRNTIFMILLFIVIIGVLGFAISAILVGRIDLATSLPITIATVIGADLPALAQLRPGQEVAFTLTDPASAVAAARAQAACLQQVRARLDPILME